MVSLEDERSCSSLVLLGGVAIFSMTDLSMMSYGRRFGLWIDEKEGVEAR
jgi:hypothetical protein